MKISAVVLTQNNEKTIKRCLQSLAFAEEIIVVDSFSSDKTIELCKRFSKKVFSKRFCSYGASRNFGAAKAKNPWVFFIDSDEEASSELANTLKGFCPTSSAAAFSVLIKANYLGAWMKSRAISQWQPRLLKKSSARWSSRLVHPLPEINGKTLKLNGALLHHSIQTVSEHLKKIEDYSSKEAIEKKRQGKSDSLFLFPFCLLFDAAIAFLKAVVFGTAFLDGWRGMLFSFFAAYYEALSDYKFFLKKY